MARCAAEVALVGLEVAVADGTVGRPVDRASVADRTEGFDAWVLDAGPRLLRLACAVGFDEHAAADAVQDAMVAVLVRWSRLDDGSAADAYARRVVINRRISWWRRIGRRESVFAEPPEVGGEAVDQRLTDRLLARRLLVTLPLKQRVAVALHFLDDLSYAEIADLLDCTESTARSHVHRALARLRTELEQR